MTTKKTQNETKFCISFNLAASLVGAVGLLLDACAQGLVVSYSVHVHKPVQDSSQRFKNFEV